jgi:hypothetical protein
MKTRLILAVLFAALLGAGPALAQRVAVPLVDYPNLPVATASGKVLSAEQVKQAIQNATKAKGWAIAFDSAGNVIATLNVRAHMIMVQIAYSPEKYSITYKDSSNMKYAPNAQADNRINSANSGYTRDGYNGPVIHPNYNRWTGDLKDAIRVELQKA